MASKTAKTKIRKALKPKLDSLNKEQLIDVVLRMTEANYDDDKLVGINSTLDFAIGRICDAIQEIEDKEDQTDEENTTPSSQPKSQGLSQPGTRLP